MVHKRSPFTRFQRTTRIYQAFCTFSPSHKESIYLEKIAENNRVFCLYWSQ